jgi:hypothetical protein
LTDPGRGIVVDLERILGHQSDGAGDPARAFLLTLDAVVVASRLWSGHPRIMGRFTMLTGDPSHRCNRTRDATLGRDRARLRRTRRHEAHLFWCGDRNRSSFAKVATAS